MSHRSSPVLVPLAFVVALSACTNDAPFDPALAPAEPTPASLRLSLSSGQQAGLEAMLEDVQIRIMPSLMESGDTLALEVALFDLSAALEVQDAAMIATTAERLQAALTDFERTAGVDAQYVHADLEAMKLALQEIQSVIPESVHFAR
jgi:hypothetical protein